jgi:hypothetical protein
MPEAWRKQRPDGAHYKSALNNWRQQKIVTQKEIVTGKEDDNA